MAINYGKLRAKMTPRGSMKASMSVAGPSNKDYETLLNKPQINGNELIGNKTNEDLGIPTKVSDLDNDLNFVADENYVHTDNNYDDTDKGKVDALGTASTKNVPAEGNASASEVVMGSDTRLTDSRNAKDVYDWAKAQTKPSYNYSEIDNTPTLGTASSKDVATSGDASTSQVVMGNDSRLTDDRNAKDVYSWAKASAKPDYSASEVGAIASTLKGTANGVAELDANGKVPSAQLPSYVDDVLEYASVSAFPQTGESGKIYIALDTNKTYRWSGTTYTEISESLALGETDSTAYAGNKGKANADNIANIQSLIPSSATTSNKLATANDIPDISGKADKSEMLVSTSGDQTTIQLKNGTSATVLNAHQDISGKANKSEMSVSTSGDKTTIQLKNGTSAEVINQHQDISNKVDKDGNKVLSTNDYTTAEKTKLDGISDEANKVTSSSTNGHINIDGVDTIVYDDTAVTTAISGLNENVEDIQDVITTDTTPINGNPISISGVKSTQLAVDPVITFEPIQAGSGTPSPENIRPISGYDKIEVLSCGKNLFDGTWQPWTPEDGTRLVYNANAKMSVTRIKANTTFTIYKNGGNRFFILEANEYPVIRHSYPLLYNGATTQTGSQVIQTSANAMYLLVYVDNNNATGIQLQVEEGNVASPVYVPYHKTTSISESLGQTVYGGSLDVRSGKVISNRILINLKGFTAHVYGNDGIYISNVLNRTGDRIKGICSHAFVRTTEPTWESGQVQLGASNATIYWLNILTIMGKTIEEFNTWLASEDVWICYDVGAGNYTEIQLAPHEISLLKDYAYLSTNGTSIALDYHNGELASLADVSQLGETLNILGDNFSNHLKVKALNYLYSGATVAGTVYTVNNAKSVIFGLGDEDSFGGFSIFYVIGNQNICYNMTPTFNVSNNTFSFLPTAGNSGAVRFMGIVFYTKK